MIDRRQFVSWGTLAATAVASGAANGAFAQEATTPGATVETASGKVRGTLQGKVHAFKGIPYGASTAPPHRFMPPRKPQPWAKVRDAYQLGPRSPQLISAFRGF